SDNILYCLDAETGKERWQFVTGGAITSTPLINEGAIFFGSFDHVLYALPLAI
ncbi:MAG: PQQ-binding-like beta-propeller repeat protein, partial [Anaerolineae bacterium]|nr:PQQ-binding-like beta-propeller repeat protein [Anaerolineae bacterium]